MVQQIMAMKAMTHNSTLEMRSLDGRKKEEQNRPSRDGRRTQARFENQGASGFKSAYLLIDLVSMSSPGGRTCQAKYAQWAAW